MERVLELAKELKIAAKVGDVGMCMRLLEQVAKVMETYKRSC